MKEPLIYVFVILISGLTILIALYLSKTTIDDMAVRIESPEKGLVFIIMCVAILLLIKMHTSI